MTPDEFRGAFFTVSHQMQAVMHQLMVPLCQQQGLSAQQLHVLVELKRAPGQTAGQLSDRAGILRTNFAPVCRKLEQRGLVQRRRSERDHRSWKLFATAEGLSVLAAIEEQLQQTCQQALADEPQQTLDDIEAGFLALHRLMAKIGA